MDDGSLNKRKIIGYNHTVSLLLKEGTVGDLQSMETSLNGTMMELGRVWKEEIQRGKDITVTRLWYQYRIFGDVDVKLGIDYRNEEPIGTYSLTAQYFSNQRNTEKERDAREGINWLVESLGLSIEKDDEEPITY
jgi:hypothetical protein